MTPTQLCVTKRRKGTLELVAERPGTDEQFIPETIWNIENRRFNPAPATVEKITCAFASRGVAFIEDRTMQGVAIISKGKAEKLYGAKVTCW